MKKETLIYNILQMNDMNNLLASLCMVHSSSPQSTQAPEIDDIIYMKEPSLKKCELFVEGRPKALF